MEILIKKLKIVFDMNEDLLAILNTEDFKKKLPNLRSNTIGSQFYCIGGARESYGESIKKDCPFNWNCTYSHEDINDKSKFVSYLTMWKNNILDYLNEESKLSENQITLIMDLYAHEYLHQGQLIRYIYANNIEIPQTWKDFWHLTD